MSRRHHLTFAYRMSVLSRTVAAVVGGYAFATLCSLLLSRILPMTRADAVAMTTLLSFVFYAVAAIWVFAAKTALRAWIGLLVPTAIAAMAWWGLR